MAIETSTIANLRTKTSNTADVYYTTDIGQEGEWYYDATDITSIDNLGTILVSIIFLLTISYCLETKSIK